MDAIKNDTVWNKVMKMLSDAGFKSAPMEVVKSAAIDVAKAYLGSFLGH